MCQGGDFSNRNGTGGESIYGGEFRDENFKKRHTKAGQLSMANAGPNTQGSQFFLTLTATPHLDGKHVVFGELIEGMELLKRMGNVKVNGSDKPLQEVKISGCGVWPIAAATPRAPPAAAPSAHAQGSGEKKRNREEGGDESKERRGDKKDKKEKKKKSDMVKKYRSDDHNSDIDRLFGSVGDSGNKKRRTD
jgi:peptidyl-prolyl isomerase G (cyclophilin G)